MKTDARVRYTKKVLREALFACLKKKPIKEVSVKEVCEFAELNRATFYRHYRDCYDILGQLQEEQVEEFRRIFLSRDKFSEELTEAILDLLEKNRDLNEAAVNGKITGGMIQRIMEVARECSIDDWKRSMPKATDQEVEMLFSAVMAATFQIIINEGRKYDRETKIRFVHVLVESCIRPYV